MHPEGYIYSFILRDKPKRIGLELSENFSVRMAVRLIILICQHTILSQIAFRADEIS